MKFKLSLVAFACLASQSLFAATEPSKIIISCKTKVIGDNTVQIYGNLTADGLDNVTYVNIDVWNPDVAPIVRKGEVWKADLTYKPTKKYAGYQRYLIQENTAKLVGYQLIVPPKSVVFAEAMKKAKKNGENRMVQGEFEAVLRYREDFHNDVGGQEYLECGTGWLDVR